MLARLVYRMTTQVSPRLLWKAAWLWARKGSRALKAHRRRLERGELFPPFLFLSLTSACNLRCRGCWVQGSGPVRQLEPEQVERIITAGKRQQVFFYTLLGGEPMLYPGLWDLIEQHPECYFQIITNGMFFTDENVRRIRRAGNVTPLVSVDGMAETNDQRRGPNVFHTLSQGIVRLREAKVLFGIATTITAGNFDEVLSRRFVHHWIDAGAMYLWYYVFRPMGVDPAPELCLEREQMIALRRRLLELRRQEPIVLIDTYWDAEGRALCPAAHGLGYHIGPEGSIEPCPPLSMACQTVAQADGELFETINRSDFLRGFQEFVHQHTRGCVILERPRELAEFLRRMSARDFSGRDLLAELETASPRSSHHLPGQELPEDHWLYRALKRRFFFGMGAYG